MSASSSSRVEAKLTTGKPADWLIRMLLEAQSLHRLQDEALDLQIRRGTGQPQARAVAERLVYGELAVDDIVLRHIAKGA